MKSQITPEQLEKVLRQVHGLVKLASNEASTAEERRTAGARACVLIQRYDLAIVPYEDVVYPERARAAVVEADGSPSILATVVDGVAREIGDVVGRGLKTAATEVARRFVGRRGRP